MVITVPVREPDARQVLVGWKWRRWRACQAQVVAVQYNLYQMVNLTFLAYFQLLRIRLNPYAGRISAYRLASSGVSCGDAMLS
jgi:hypothetical protein